MPRKVIEDDEDEMESYEGEEEEDEGQDEYENDGFIVNEVDEEEHEKGGANNDVERLKKKRRRKTESQKNYVLDEDDYELIKDNKITGFHRPEESKKLKRLRKAQRDEFERTGIVGRTAEEMFQHSLFGDDEEQQEDEDANIGDEDDLADFIVEEEEIDDHGSPASMKVNKKLSKKAAGSHVVFGDIDDPFNRRKQGLTKMSVYDDESSRRMERRIKDEFGPTIPSDKYMPEKDDMIQHTDIPERIQIFEQSIGPLPTDECSIDEESIWICKQLTNMTHLYGRNIEKAEEVHELSIAKDDVIRFLDLMHIQKLDVPFIAMYRKDECSSLFKDPYKLEADEFNDSSNREPALIWHKILWTILDLDRKWLLLKKRKSALQLYYNKIYVEESRILNDEARLNLIKQLFDSISKSLKAAESEREVDDVDSKFSLHFPPGEVGDVDGRYKRPKRKSQYSICSKAGLGEVASKFGYSSEQFGLQISLGKMRMEELLDREETPEELAANYICALFGTPQDVLRGARHMAAAEISCEPNVRKHVRSIFMDNAVVSTSPTPDGNVAIKTFHQYATVKWLREKPLTKFVDAQWLLIQKAEEEKLIRVTIKLPGSVMDKLTNDFNENYLSGGASKSALSWNEQRKQILQDALFSFLLPSMEKEARLLLTSRAKSWLIWEYGKLLWDKVSVGPYKRDEQDLKSDEEAAPRVMACCWGFGKTATTFVMLDSFGEVLDVLPTRSLSNRSQNVNDQQRKKNDQQRVLKFMSDHQPHVIVLGAANVSCTRLKEDIYEIISKTAEDNPSAFGKEMNGISILYGDEALPQLYENSRISSDQLPLQSGIVKRAVALGRYLQNPLAMVATLCGLGKEILSWKLSPLEDFLTSDEKYGMVEQVLVDVTNQVGLDINLAASHDWLFSTMQFISGLGPRKAASLMRSLVRTGATFTRKELTTHGLGRKVFINTVGFLRVRRIGMAAASSQYIDMLDDTRIHPESYGLAQGLAKDIYIQDIQEDRNDDEVLEMAIEHVREKPNLLKSLEVREYAESKQLGNKIETINLIRSELIHGFRDWRRQYAEPSQDEEFCMISGESEDGLAEGRIVQATVRRVQPQRAICALDSGLTGMLSKEDYADDCSEDTDLTEKLKEGDVVTCKIKSIQKDRYQLFLSCKESEMRNNQYQNHQNIDPYYQEDLKSLPVDQEKTGKQKELARKYFKPRMIVHPRFQNITADEAIEFLSHKDIGESIVRPSSLGPSYLTLTLKVYDGVYAHKDLIEGGKEHKDITSLLRIGKVLKIGDDTFEDLDEVITRYVDPLVSQLKKMLNYQKFKKGTKAEVDEFLRIEKAKNPMRIVYCFGISHEHPGTCILTYIRSSNPHHEYVAVYPTGFKFRRKMFDEINQLVAYFQKHIDDPQNSAIRGSSGGYDGCGSNGGDWGSQSSDLDKDSTPGSRAGRGGYRNGDSQEGHPSGLPRPYNARGRGRGRGQGRGSYNGNSRDDGGSSDGGGGGDSACGWGGSGSGGGTSGGWGGSEIGGGGKSNLGGSETGAWGGSKTGGDDDGGTWGGNKTGSGGGDSGGTWGGSKTGSDGGDGVGWGGNKTGSDGGTWGGNKPDSGGGSDGGAWGGSKTGSDGGAWGSNKPDSGGGDGGAWGGSKTGSDGGGREGIKTGSDGGGLGGNKLDSGGDDGGAWGGNKTGIDGGAWVGGGTVGDGNKTSSDGGGWGGNKTGSDGGGWGGNKTDSDGGDWGGNKTGSDGGTWGSNKPDSGGGDGGAWGGSKTGSDVGGWGGNKTGNDGGGWGGSVTGGDDGGSWGGGSTGGSSSGWGGSDNSDGGRGGRGDGRRGRGGRRGGGTGRAYESGGGSWGGDESGGGGRRGGRDGRGGGRRGGRDSRGGGRDGSSRSWRGERGEGSSWGGDGGGNRDSAAGGGSWGGGNGGGSSSWGGGNGGGGSWGGDGGGGSWGGDGGSNDSRGASGGSGSGGGWG